MKLETPIVKRTKTHDELNTLMENWEFKGKKMVSANTSDSTKKSMGIDSSGLLTFDDYDYSERRNPKAKIFVLTNENQRKLKGLDLTLDYVETRSHINKLETEIALRNGDNCLYTVHCPYTGELVKEVFSPHEDFKRYGLDLRSEERETRMDYLNYMDFDKRKRVGLDDKKVLSEVYNSLVNRYSKEFITVFKALVVNTKLNQEIAKNIILLEDHGDWVSVKYTDTGTVTRKEISIDREGNRTIKKGKTIIVPTPDLDIDYELEKLKELGIKDYKKDVESRRQVDYNLILLKVKEIMNSDLSEKDKVFAINEVTD